MMPAKKVTSIREARTKPGKRPPNLRIYFPSEAAMKECEELIHQDYEAGRLTTNKASQFFYFLYCRYKRERREAEAS
jgi:hypothetical protein